jgi:hypothetical protein
MLKKLARLSVLFFLVLGLIIAGVWIIDVYKRPAMIASILKIDKPPNSMMVHGCSYPITTDILTTCAISIEPSEFNLLVAGHEFEVIESSGSSYNSVGPDVGKEFEVDVEYSVQPKEFKHGGFVRVIVNKERGYALIDEYIE